jgi:diadenosine tetraphosphate (Ap4A) HIT family hydrolase
MVNDYFGANMKTIQVKLDNEIASKIESRTYDEEMSIDVFLSKIIETNVDKLIRPKKWMPLEKWTAFLSGENCPDCNHLQSGCNPHGFPIAKLNICRLDLMRSQFVPGACVLYCLRHVTEPYELNKEEQQDFFEDLMRSAKALADVFKPIKMNYQILGNISPHLHAYLQPRFYGDAEPGWPTDPFKEQIILTEIEYQERVNSIQQALIKIL